LRERLQREVPDVTLWQDRADLEGGTGWWKQITEALDRVEILIMVITPAAMRSDTARKEWRYARQQGARICPVMATLAGLDFDGLPTWMRKAHFYDLEREWPSFVAFLRGVRKDSRVPFMAPDLRDGFVARPRELGELLRQLLDAARANPIAATVALQGTGGFGKTTLATALCHDDDVIAAFDDGILWVTLGARPHLQNELTKLYAALTGERPGFVDIDDAAIQVAARLEEKHCLVVIDDVWDPHHAEPFLRGGRNCARLLTTRQLKVVTELGASRVSVSEMNESESVAMLTARLRDHPVEHAPLRELARRLGEWPLLLKLASSQLQSRLARGDTFQGGLAYLNRALDKRGVVAFDREAGASPHDAVSTTVGVSLNMLDLENRRRCIELAVLPEDRAIPLATLEALWGADRVDTETLVEELDDASLVDFDVKTGAVRIHDVLRAVLATMLGDPQAIHRRLVTEGWKDPYALPDRYAWRFFGWHLARAGETARLRLLLLDPAWIRRKLEETYVHALIQDYELIPDDRVLAQVCDAIRLSSAAIGRDVGQLATQLAARLVGDTDEVQRLLDDAAAAAARPWLRLQQVSLTRPGGPLVAILKGHTQSVEAIAISADGRRAVSGGSDWSVRVWELPSGRLARTLDGHGATVNSVELFADARRAVSASDDRSVTVWNLENGAADTMHRRHSGALHAAALLPDGSAVVSISEDGTVRLWDLATGEVRRILGDYSHHLRGLAVSPDGRFAVFGSGDWNAAVLDLREGKVVKTLAGHSRMVRSVAVSADGRMVVTGAEDKSIRVWDLASGAASVRLDGHADTVHVVRLSADGQRIVSGSSDNTVRVWDVATGAPLNVLHGHSGWVKAIALHPDGERILSGSGDRTIRIWKATARDPAGASDVRHSTIALLAIAADGQRAVSGSRILGTKRTALQVWDVGRGRAVRELEGHEHVVEALTVSGDGRRALTGAADHSMRLWDLETGQAVHVLTGHSDAVIGVSMCENGSRAVSISRDRTMRVWDLVTGRALLAARRPATSRADSPLGFLDLDTGQVLDLLRASVGRDSLVALSSGGERVVFTSGASLVTWEIASGASRAIELGDLDPVAIDIDATATLAVLGSRFGAVGVFDVERGRALATFEGDTRRVADVCLTPDRRRVVVAGPDESVEVWDLATGERLTAAGSGSRRGSGAAVAPLGDFVYAIAGDTVSARRADSGPVLGTVTLDHNITTLAVARDGRTIALGDDSGRVHFARLEG